MSTELNESDLNLIEGIENYISESKREGIPRDRALGEMNLLMQVACLLEDPTPQAQARLNEIVHDCFDEKWPVNAE